MILGTDLVIRDVNVKIDAASIAKIYNYFVLNTDITFDTEALSVADMEKKISHISKSFPYIVCEVRSRIIGFAYVHEWNPRAAYSRSAETTIYISPEYTNQGFGKILFGILEDECRKQDISALVALITSTNFHSCNFHEKIGFEKVGQLKEIGMKFDKLLDVSIYEKLLDTHGRTCSMTVH